MLKAMKGGLPYTQVFSAMVLIIIASAALLVYKAESGMNAKTIDELARARLMEAYANKIITDSCLLANDSLNNRRWFILNRTFIESTPDGAPLPCLGDDIEYILNITIYTPDFNNVLSRKTFKNVAGKKLNATMKYHLSTDDGYPVIVEFTYLNVTLEGR